jgi:hypothetical protein
MLPQIDAIVPMLCVTLAALASMGAEAFRAKDERMPIGSLGVVGLIGAAASAVLLWNRGTESFGVIVADNFGRGRADHSLLVAGDRARRAALR